MVVHNVFTRWPPNPQLPGVTRPSDKMHDVWSRRQPQTKGNTLKVWHNLFPRDLPNTYTQVVFPERWKRPVLGFRYGSHDQRAQKQTKAGLNLWGETKTLKPPKSRFKPTFKPTFLGGGVFFFFFP